MYPLWGQFIDQLADHAVKEGKAEDKDAKRWKADGTSTPQQRVNVIVRRLGEDRYRNFLKATFGPRYHSDRRRYTPTHAALLRLPFRGYVTTNYDPALEFARMELRQNCLTTGTPTWQNDDEVHRWLTGEVFRDGHACPILWLHGSWQRPEGIILNGAEYFAAYRPGLYRRFFDSLWSTRHVVFVGFGFSDPHFTFMVGEYLRDIKDTRADAMHIAILGVPLERDGSSPDEGTIQDCRDTLEADFHVRPLFYPAPGNDHSALQVLLEAVAPACERQPAVPEIPAWPLAPAAIPSKWVHETTNDEKFTGRDDELARLDRWVRDNETRAIGVCAVGGTGKTALVGHWLKNTKGWQSRPFKGLFGWSFYQDRDPDGFLLAFLLWAHEHFETPKPQEKAELVRAALKVIRAFNPVVVLDGLEVLQEGPEDGRYGSFLSGKLREFLGAYCQQDNNGLAVLTSRFVFADLERFLGTSFHQLELTGLLPDQGAVLLGDMDVRGSASAREEISDRLEGHPLALRVFAEALPDAGRDDPIRFFEHAFSTSEISAGSPLNDKLRRLLAFYEHKLSPVQSRLLSVVALFRSPVADEAVLRLVRGLFGESADAVLPDDTALAGELRQLHTRGILSREPIEGGHGSACHPILRDHFRALLLRAGQDTARRAADLLEGHPADEEPRSLKEIEPVLLAIELLLDSGEFKGAADLLQDRLERGTVFVAIPAPAAGVSCTLGFVRDDERRAQLEKLDDPGALAQYVARVGFLATLSGDLDVAHRFLSEAAELARLGEDADTKCVVLEFMSELLVALGQLADSSAASTEALLTAEKAKETKSIIVARACRGWVYTLSATGGQLILAAEDFACANELQASHSNLNSRFRLRGNQWAELLLLTGHTSAAASRTQEALSMSERITLNDEIARCRWMFGWCALNEGRLDDAEAELHQAEAILHNGQLLFDLARLHVTSGLVALARRDTTEALRRAGEALAVAAPRGMRLVHSDALVVRGRARLLSSEPDSAARAADDAEEALRLARDCGCAWAERDALFLQADAFDALAKTHDVKSPKAAGRYRADARRALADAQALAAKLVLTENDLVDAERKAKAWLASWEAEK
jgi:tetratricopeptide (TPR) repeat protein